VRTVLWILTLHITAVAAFPSADGYVNDFASVLTDADETYLEEYLRTLERDTSAELAVVTVQSLNGVTIEEYANRLFAEWGIGKDDRDNGVLLLVAVGDKAVRIEVGYGLEPILPDGLAGEIIRSDMLPEFRAGNLRRGIGRGVDRVARIVRQQPSGPRSGEQGAAVDDDPPVLLIMPFFGVFLGLAGFSAGLAIRTRTVAPLVAGGMFAGIPLFIAADVASLPWIGGLVLVGLLAMAAGYRAGLAPYWRGMLRTGRPGSVRDEEPLPWVMGGTDGSTASGSDGPSNSHGDSSGADFGGGSSGGGGASGRW
jgi:uncharacterized protein